MRACGYRKVDPTFGTTERIERHIQAGMSRSEAEAKAYREFGSMTLAKRGMQEVRVMRTSVAVAAVIGVALCVAGGTSGVLPPEAGRRSNSKSRRRSSSN
jgi:hypothetical protein